MIKHHLLCKSSNTLPIITKKCFLRNNVEKCYRNYYILTKIPHYVAINCYKSRIWRTFTANNSPFFPKTKFSTYNYSNFLYLQVKY